MADAPEPCSPHGWTLDTLETHLASKIGALDRFCVTSFAQSKERVDMALAASDKAIAKAETATDKRFDGVNELRGALSDQANTLMPRSEYQVQHGALSDRLSVVADTVTKLEARIAGKSEGLGSVGTIVLGILVGLNSLFAIGAIVISLYRR